MDGVADWRNGGVLSGFRRSRKYGRMSKTNQPLSLSRFIAPNIVERSIKRLPPSGSRAPRDDNIPLLIAIIPLHYGAFRDPTQRELCRSAHCISAVCRETDSTLEEIYDEFTCARALRYICTPRLQTFLSWNLIRKYQGTCPKHFPASCGINSVLYTRNMKVISQTEPSRMFL